jgi:hypothetical protein
MWDFIWHLRGSILLDSMESNEVLLDRVERLLKRQRKPIVERGVDYVVFDSPIWTDIFSPNWLAMVMYDHGRIWIEQGVGGRKLRYDLSSLHGFVFCLCGALMFFIFVALTGGGLAMGLMAAAFAIGWLYGMNLILAVTRVPHSIHKSIRQA